MFRAVPSIHQKLIFLSCFFFQDDFDVLQMSKIFWSFNINHLQLTMCICCFYYNFNPSAKFWLKLWVILPFCKMDDVSKQFVTFNLNSHAVYYFNLGINKHKNSQMSCPSCINWWTIKPTIYFPTLYCLNWFFVF